MNIHPSARRTLMFVFVFVLVCGLVPACGGSNVHGASTDTAETGLGSTSSADTPSTSHVDETFGSDVTEETAADGTEASSSSANATTGGPDLPCEPGTLRCTCIPKTESGCEAPLSCLNGICIESARRMTAGMTDARLVVTWHGKQTRNEMDT